MSNGAAIYFHNRFDQPVAVVGALAFLYGIVALYARALGGYLSDVMFESWSLRGRLLAQFVCMLAQGLLNIWFARMDTLGASVGAMVVFSILVQVSVVSLFFCSLRVQQASLRFFLAHCLVFLFPFSHPASC